jgi:hypothetical protein
MRLALERALPASPAAVWPLLTDGEQINRWSLARVRRIDPGDGGAPGSVGELREVTIRALGRPVRIEEVIELSLPPAQLGYRVVHGGGLAGHHGRISVEETAGGSVLRWEVEFHAAVPGADPIMARLLRGQLERSLGALAEVSRGAPAVPLPPTRILDEDSALPGLYAEAEAILAEQRALADRLQAAGDPKRFFARVYQYVTEHQLRDCRAGAPRHPAWVLRLIPRFHYYFAENLRRWLDPGAGRIEAHWRSAFVAMEGAPRWFGSAFKGALFGLAKGVQAHIEEDLPRTLAEIYVWHYRARCDYGRFRADYALMADLFREAAERLSPEIPRQGVPLWVRLVGDRLPRAAREALTARRFYDIPRQRRRAFQRGERLAALLAGSLSSDHASIPR